MVDIETLKRLLEMSWCKETAEGFWWVRFPSLNQCSTTALIVQDELGGQIVHQQMTNKFWHTKNVLDDGTEIDLTLDQFRYLKVCNIDLVPDTTKAVDRQTLLNSVETSMKYELLKKLVEQNKKVLNIPA